MKKQSKKIKRIKLSAIDKKVLSVSIRERQRVGKQRAKRYQINYMR